MSKIFFDPQKGYDIEVRLNFWWADGQVRGLMGTEAGLMDC